MAFRRNLSTLVVVALLFAQTLGLLHAVIHAPHLRQGETAAAAAEHTGARPSQLLSDAFSHEAGDTTCRLFDALAGGSGVAAASAPAAVCPASAGPLFARLAQPHAAPCAQFEARGPPALS